MFPVSKIVQGDRVIEAEALNRSEAHTISLRLFGAFRAKYGRMQTLMAKGSDSDYGLDVTVVLFLGNSFTLVTFSPMNVTNMVTAGGVP